MVQQQEQDRQPYRVGFIKMVLRGKVAEMVLVELLVVAVVAVVRLVILVLAVLEPKVQLPKQLVLVAVAVAVRHLLEAPIMLAVAVAV
jgi:hypothetical protein